jgi:hypothetical protein
MSKDVDAFGRKLPASKRRKRIPSPVAGGKLRKQHVAAHLGVHVATVDRRARSDVPETVPDRLRRASHTGLGP